jgi:glyoxylase-like metal-dependent hydrolase (beta-lactamase superfamily II)
MTVTYTTTRLADHVWAIDEHWVQCYLIEGTKGAVLFDCCASGGADFVATVASLTDKPVDLVFSHTDGDHTGAQEFFETPALHPAEYDYYVSKGNAGKPVRPVWEGDVIDIGSVELEVILLPGHTPGSIALLDRAARHLYCGDTISDAWIYLFGPGRNLPALIESLRKLEQLTPSFDAIHPGHGTKSLDPSWVRRTRLVAQQLDDGELIGAPAPNGLPCLLYSDDGVNLLYQPR